MRHARTVAFGVVAVTITLVTQVSAYELGTHRRISRFAFEQTSNAPSILASELRVTFTDPLKGAGGQQLDASEWVQEGSAREDDILSALNLVRVRHHFYDPLYDQPLTKLIEVGLRAHEWALEEPEAIPGQSFSWKDGRRSLLQAFTAETPARREQELAATFKILGHVVHLVQDMGVPEHTRNDWHAGRWPPLFPLGTPSLYEAWVEEQLEAYTNGGFFDGYAPQSFPRLRDYWVTGDGKGLSEFTNRSFVSKASNFTRLEEGATGRDPESGRAYPFPRLELSRRYVEEIAVENPAGSGPPLTGIVTFFGNQVFDPTTGQSEENRRLTTFGLFDAELVARQGDPIFTLNRYNVDAAAGFLLRRAVGYSAGLINHFFRTRLDVDVLQAEPSDPSIVRIEGINDGPDAMHDGRLLLYADDTDGRRMPAVPLGIHPAIAAVPGGPIVSGLFEVPADAERLVAVYRGGLGTEHPAPGGLLTPDVPGAVIGKVLGGQRVEHVFPDWSTGLWNLRTPTGVFPLPILVDDIVDLRWGDADNWLVGRTAFGRLFGEPNEIVAYEIMRPRGSIEVPLSAGTVHLEERQRRRFPFGLPLGIRVHLAHAVEFEQKLVTFDYAEQIVDGTRTSQTVGHRGTDTFRDSKVLTAGWDLALDLDKLDANARPHRWTLMHAALREDGTLLAVVRVRLTQPTDPNSFATFAARKYASPEPACTFPCPAPTLQDGPTIAIPYEFPSAGDIAVVVDVTNSTVVYSTAPRPVLPGLPSVVTLAHTTRHTRYNNGSSPFVAVGFAERTTINTDSGETVSGFFYNAQGNQSGASCDPPGFARLDTVPATGGTTFANAVRFPEEIASKDGPGALRHDILEDRFCVAAISSGPTYGYDVVTDRPLRLLTGLSVERVARAPGSPERLVFQIADPPGPGGGFSGRVIFWDPGARVATMHRIPTAELAGIQSLGREAAWFRASTTSHYVPREETLEPKAFVVDFDDALPFRILDDRRLYSADTLRFHALDPELKRTVLPARLAGDGNREGDYHAVSLK